MMSSVTDRPYSGKSIYRRRRVFLSRSPRVVVKFPDPQHKTLFVELFTTSARRQCVNVLLMCFCCFLRTVSNTVIHFEARLAAGISFCAAVRGGTKGWRGELHVSVDTMKWLIDYTGAGLIKIHRGGQRHTMAGVGTNCSPAPSRRYINCTFQSIGVQRCSSISCKHSGACDRGGRWELCTYGSVYCIFTVVCVRGRAGARCVSPATLR